MKTPGPTDISFAQDRMAKAETPREMARVLIETFDLDDMDLGGWRLEDGMAALLEVVQGYSQEEYEAHGEAEYDRGRENEKSNFPSDALDEVKAASEKLDAAIPTNLRAVLREDLVDAIDDASRALKNGIRMFDE